MRILLVCHGYPPFGVAGVERLTQSTAKALSGRGHEVTVMTRRPSAAPPNLALEREVREGISVLTLAGGGADARSPGIEATLELWFERLIVELDPEAIVITHLLHHSPRYVAIAQRWGIPVVLELHDFFAVCPRAHLQRISGDLCDGPDEGRACASHCFSGETYPESHWGLRERSYAEAVRAADVVLAPSVYLADRLGALRGQGSPIEVVENAVTISSPAIRVEPDVRAPLKLASIGVLTPHKGFHIVVEALRRAALPAARYTIFGAALRPYQRQLRIAAEQVSGLEMHLFDRFSPSHLPALLADVDVLVVPSLVPETFSIVVREAFACGIPVIASRIGALPEAITDRENGWLFEPGDASALAATLQLLDSDRDLLLRAAEAIRPNDTVSIETRTERLDGLIEAAAARQRAQQPSPVSPGGDAANGNLYS